MAETRNTNISNGVISALVLACGIIFSILVALLFRKLFEMVGFSLSSSGFDSTAVAYASSPYWSFGFAFIIPGIIGVIASLVRQKCGYIIQMVICIIVLVVMGIFFVVALIALFSMSLFNYTKNYSSCRDVAGSCVCNSGFSGSTVNFGQSCYEINSISAMAIGATVMLVIGWILVLAASITGGMLACARESSPGTIIHGQQPQVTVMQMGQMPPGYVAQPGYGQPAYGGQPYVVQPGYSAHGGVVQQSYGYDNKERI